MYILHTVRQTSSIQLMQPVLMNLQQKFMHTDVHNSIIHSYVPQATLKAQQHTYY
uniref:Uncharacterized protein n=1 Tax=Arundo donax TaxID=35708 RepID=A0A0A9E2Y0_ARUDO